MRSTVSPFVRHGVSRIVASGCWARTGPGGGGVAVEGVEIFEAEVGGDGALERLVGGAAAGAGDAGDRDERVDPLAALRRAAERMQAVADLHLLQLAEIGVERPERAARNRHG